MTLTLKKATKEHAKLHLALIGLSGSGKTYSALNLAKYLVPDGTVLLLDSEHRTAKLYGDIFDFNHEEVTNYDPRNYIKLIKEAEALGVDVLIIDSMSHAWNAIVDIANQEKSKGPFGGWDKASPIYRQFIDAILGCNMHVIATMRQKSDYVIEPNASGKQTPKKVGMKAENKESIEYEFDVVGEFDRDDHSLKITKSRFSEIDQKIFYLPGQELANELRRWLNTGVPAAPAKKPEQQSPMKTEKIAPGAEQKAAASASNDASAPSESKPAGGKKVELGKLFTDGVKHGWKIAETKKFVSDKFSIPEKDLQSQLTPEQFEQALKHVTSGAKPGDPF